MESTGRFTPELRRLMARSYDVCESCGTRLTKETPALAGYRADGAPLYVGPCCEHLLVERATHVYWWWEVDKRCPPALMLWRYMDFAKFVALLEQKALHFARADKLGDPFEGATGIQDRLPAWEAFYRDFFRKAVATAPDQMQPPSEEVLAQEADRLLADFKRSGERDRLRAFASCWHANSVESEALWRLYCPPPSAGVAIRTTAAALETSLRSISPVKIGRVQYVDFKRGFAGLHDRIYWKRKSLAHEAEVRAVIEEFDPQAEVGRAIPVELDTLMLGVVPSPYAPVWFEGLVADTLTRYGLNAPVERSELLAEPFF
jgi:hypothetical protein